LRLFVAARLDQLPSAEKNLLQHLSSCGDDIQDDDLASMPETPEPERLRPLVRRRLLVEVEPRRWRFSHGVVREVAYASLPRRARRDLHRRQLVTTAAADDPGRRAFHARSWAESTSSEDAEERRTSLNFALRETRLHAESLFRMHADSAHAAIRQVTGLLDDGASAAPEEAADLLLLRSACEVEMWRFDEAVESATEAVQLCREHDLGPSRLSHALSSQGWALSRARRLNAARQAADEAFNVADSSGDLVAQANALLVTGSTWRYESLPTYIAMTEDAYNLYVRAGDTNGAGESARWLAYLLSESVPTVAEKWLKNANAATAVTDLRGQAWIARATALASAVRLDLRTAREAAARSVHLGTLLGALDIVGDGLAVLVESAAAFGDFTGMRDALERMDEQAESTDNPRLKLVAGSSAASGLLRSGQPEPAQRRKREALELAAMFGTSELEEASAGAAALARNQGAWDEALEHLSHAQRAGGRAPLDAYTLNLRAHEAREGRPTSPR
jgi:tetratricopeptide (TPR) repeat protein